MKRVCQLICMAAAVLLAASCVKEEIAYDCPRVEEGLPAHVTLKYEVRHRDVVTRAAQESRYEYRVENLYVFIFDGAGQEHYRHFFTMDLNGENNEDNAYGNLNLETESLNDATIVGIANVTVEGETSTAYHVTEADLEAIESLADLQAFVMDLRESDRTSLGRSALFMMTGYAKDGEGSTTVTIPGTEGSTPSELECTLELERTDAKVEFKVVTDNVNGYENFSFTPKLWSIHKVPQQSLLLPAAAGDADGEGCTYFDSRPLPFESLVTDANNLSAGGGFVFYMPENRKTPKLSATSYAQRDDCNTTAEGTDPNKDGQEYVNTDFKYANDSSTYAVLTGTVSYEDNNGKAVNAEVRYIIHLGETSDANPNDYDTKRNVHYRYTVKVQGVNDIVVEVTTGEESRPGHEGDVVFSSNRIFEFDSHYDRQLITIPGSAISDGMTWSVNTPFSSGIHDAASAEVEEALGDYKWIKFAINKDYGKNGNEYVKYPGDQNYNAESPDKAEASPSYQDYPNARLYDVQQLIERLQQDKREGTITDNSNIAITVFVDENLYIEHPITKDRPTKGEHLVLWKDMVDKDDRQLHIVTESAQYSPDGNSSVVNSLYTFKQKAIRTVFNVENEALETAWGLESVMETNRLVPGNVTWGSSTSNGRENTLSWLTRGETLHWGDVLYTSENSEHLLRDDYNSVAYACLMRNRDLDGDNVIDPDEVRWYLAAIDQLTDIYIGEYALDADSRLYPGADAITGLGGNTPYWHYASSSADGSNPWVFWSEEGASRGTYGNSSAESANGPRYAYRCIRNLGLPLDKPDEEPEDLVKYDDADGDGIYTIDLSKLNPKALRGYSDGGNDLPAHNERDADNLPRVRFEVSNETRNADGDAPNYGREWDDWSNHFTNADSWITYQNAPNACPQGYRVPNQRELLIMSTRMPGDAWPTYSRGWDSSKARYMCQTAFSMNDLHDYTNLREGFWWSANNGVFSLQNNRGETGYVRCVRDLE